MTRVFDEHGEQIPVTVLECGPCVVIRRKRADGADGYDAALLGFGDTVERRMSRPAAGLFKKGNLPFKRHCREFSLDAGEERKPGDVVNVEIFSKTTHVDITGITKGKGFQGVMRRHGMAGGFMTHGGHSKRRIGAIGCCEKPGRVYKGKPMPGHMGHTRVTQQNLKVVQVRPEDNLLLVRGAVPGHVGAVVVIKRALKKGDKE